MMSYNTPATDERVLKLENFVCFSIYSANHAFNRMYKPLLEDLGLTYPQYLVMVLLWEKDGRTVGQLGERLALESNTLTPLLKRLEALGHVTRARDPEDERQVRIRLTDSGRALRQKALCLPAEVLEASGMTLEELQQMQVQLDALKRALEGHRIPAPDKTR